MNSDFVSWALRQRTGSATGKAILLMCAHWADEEGKIKVSIEDLAWAIECSEAVIPSWLKHLEQMRLIKIQPAERYAYTDRNGKYVEWTLFISLNLEQETGR